ncbi:AAA family ATPase [Novosphingobium sp. M1R2S20]|uniref:AAA family ATPase n=1 Tax=Novosphingobium rhizovicinum TaxID=3228928 RepID=A0ABV3RED7_9SPHN
MNACDDQGETIAFLSRAGSFGAAGSVDRIDTHAAIIFLAGDRAYKLKRAVRYPYLDFSTANKRKAVCEAEVALNRRTAPDIYLGVCSVGRQADGTLALDTGEAIDWLVVMRRFAPECLLAKMADKGPLGPELVRDLADQIATFHDMAEVADGNGSDRVRAVLDGNLTSMTALAEGLLPMEDCERLHRRSLDDVDRLSPLLDRRAETGHVRHCHGDLHLANICLWQERPTLFDCLEFDAALATTDVLYDLAFLLMDLWHRGLHAEASPLFNRYCDMREEDDGLPALPLFLSMRAAVRAHVHASAAERHDRGERREAEARTARAYLAAAMGFLDRSKPQLTVIGGLSGTGKSTLAGALAAELGDPPGARWLRTDVLRKRMAGVSPETRLSPEAYTKEQSEKVYDRLATKAREILAGGTSVIADGVFAAEAERNAMTAAATEAGVPFVGLWLEAPVELLRSRVSARTGDASDADAPVVERQLEYELGDLSAWHRIEATGSPGEVLARAKREHPLP